MAFSLVAQQGRLIVLKDTVAATNSKTFDYTTDIAGTVFGGNAPRTVEILSVTLKITNTAGVGNRLLVIETLDANNNVLTRSHSGTNYVAGVTGLICSFTKGVTTASVSTFGSREVLPDGLYLCPGLKLKVYDIANIAAGDTYEVYVVLATETAAP